LLSGVSFDVPGTVIGINSENICFGDGYSLLDVNLYPVACHIK
jgi:hypothetical protein